MVLALMLAAGAALAEKNAHYVYDADEHDYEGRVVWSSDVRFYDQKGKSHEGYIWHTLNLKTGKYTTDEMRDSYIIMDDGSYEGFLTARDEGDYVAVYNVKSGYESKMIFAFVPNDVERLDDNIEVKVLGYMDEYLYYYEYRRIPDESPHGSLKRTDKHGDEYSYLLFGNGHYVLNRNGTCAWELYDKPAIGIESPEKGIFLELSAEDVDGAEGLLPVTWLSENKLLFWALRYNKFEGVMYSLNIETGAVKKYTDKKGDEIKTGGCAPYLSIVDINAEKKLAVYIYSYDVAYCDPVLWEMDKGEFTVLYRTLSLSHSGSYRKKIDEICSSDMIAVWIKD